MRLKNTVKLFGSICLVFSLVFVTAAASNSIGPVINFLLFGDESTVPGYIDSDSELGALGYRILHQGDYIEISNNQFSVPAQRTDGTLNLIDGSGKLAGYGFLVDNRFSVSHDTTAFVLLTKYAHFVGNLDSDVKEELFETLTDQQSFRDFSLFIGALSWAPLTDSQSTIGTFLNSLVSDLIKPAITSALSKPKLDREILLSNSLSVNSQSSANTQLVSDTPFLNGIALQNIQITETSNTSVSAVFDVRSKNFIYQSLRSASYDETSKSFSYGDVISFIAPKSASNLRTSFSTIEGIGQAFGDAITATQNAFVYGFVDGFANSASPGDSISRVEFEASCSKNSIVIEGSSVEARLYNAIEISMGLLNTGVDFFSWIEDVSVSDFEKMIQPFSLTVHQNVFSNPSEFREKVLLNMVRRILRGENANTNAFNLIEAISEGDLQSFKSIILSRETLSEVLETLVLSTLDVATSGAFEDLQFLPNLKRQALGAFTNFFFSVLFGDTILEETGVEVDPDYSNTSVDWIAVGDLITSSAFSYIFNASGLGIYNAAIDLVETGSDVGMIVYGASAPPAPFEVSFSNYLGECNASPGISQVVPWVANSGITTRFVATGVGLNLISAVRVGNCTTANLTQEAVSLSFDCTVSSLGVNQIEFQEIGNSEWIASGNFVSIQPGTTVAEVVASHFSGSEVEALNQPYSSTIYGSNLTQISTISIEDCPNASINFQFSNSLGIQCDGFSSPGIKKVRVALNAIDPPDIFLISIDVADDYGLVAHLEFEDSTDDSSNQNNSVVEHGSISFEAGVHGKAARFDGLGAYIELLISNHLLFKDTKPFTFAAWVKPDTDAVYPVTIASKYNLGVQAEHLFHIDVNSNGLALREVAPFAAVGTSEIVKGEFTHMASVYDGEKLSIWINGAKQAEIESGAIQGITTSTLIGANLAFGNLANLFKGMIDDLRIYNRALTKAEILDLAGVLPPLVGLFSLNDTGMDIGGNFDEVPGGTNPDCTGVEISAQDCSYGRDAEQNDNSDGFAGFSFTKLDASGNALANDAEIWACIRDNVTGLTWENKTDDGGIQDKDLNYRWGGITADPQVPLLEREGEFFDDWNILVTSLNGSIMCGFENWRVPTIYELMDLVYFKPEGAKVDTRYFMNVKRGFNQINGSDKYWSASGSVNSLIAWDMSFYNGFNGVSSRAERRHLMLVADEPGGLIRFPGTSIEEDSSLQTCRNQIVVDRPYVDNLDGTVTDPATGLQWSKCTFGLTGQSCETGTTTKVNWQEALQAANNSSLAGHQDWRLPNIKELLSLQNTACVNPAIDSINFPNTAREPYWTSTPQRRSSGNTAWSVNMDSGSLGTNATFQDLSVRLVRSATAQ